MHGPHCPICVWCLVTDPDAAPTVQDREVGVLMRGKFVFSKYLHASHHKENSLTGEKGLFRMQVLGIITARRVCFKTYTYFVSSADV